MKLRITFFLLLFLCGCECNYKKNNPSADQASYKFGAKTEQVDTETMTSVPRLLFREPMDSCSRSRGIIKAHDAILPDIVKRMPASIGSSLEMINDDPLEEYGHLTYFIPDTMIVGREYRIKLRIAKYLSAALTSGMPGNSVTAQIRIGQLMNVILKETDPDNDAFKIDTLDTNVQTIENDSSFTTWEWSVIPLKSGAHTLKLTAVIEDLKKDFPVYEKDIVIISSPLYSFQQFAMKNWQYLLSTLLIPLAVYFWNRNRKPQP